jgi:hypothetical protein
MSQIKPGDLARDTITGFEGIVIARTEWLNKCVRLTIQPQAMKDGKPIDNHTFDEEQLELVAAAAHKETKAAQTGGPTPEPAQRPNITRT